ncbi:uracil phosphoribosyltransferase homolog isoform X3 [Ursus maritimus]|uniref:Uracil phosphoribosyltransferase homolog isoform X3 n=1 Tax=Ursus maritimus TaxID=29073 RepID=A0A8M1G284_URSMA|nr:uracil phosphoribosyltransferase homolog isoform X3 [Ursus maritimus]XP_057168606.1 uracil phosphoribosyltransferase homolog isoform X6 [Ursus arctos]
MDLRCSDSTPCHDQKANSVSTPSSEPLRPGDLISDQAGGNSASKSKPTVLAGHAPSSVPAELEPQACGVAGLNSESSGGSGNCDASTGESLLGDREVSQQIGTQLKLLPMNDQIRELQTIIRDKTASRGDFMFSADRLIRLVVEEGLNQLPYKECMVTTPTGYKYEGVKFEKGNCGVSIMRSGTGNTVIEAVKVLIEHGVQPSVIILLSLFSTPHGECSMTGHGLGAKSIIQEFPEITILTTEVHPVAPTHFGQKYFGTD